MDSLSRMGFTKDDPDVRAALDWFVENQEPDGLWNLTYVEGKQAPDNEVNRERRLWLSLAVARVFKRLQR